MSTVTIVLPIPPRQLSPNYTVGSRGARMGKAAKTKTYRSTAKLAAFEKLGLRPRPRWEAATAQVTWFAKDARRRDKDNCLASLKSAFDGLVDAGLLADDSGLTHLPMVILKDADNPRVEITITQTQPTGM